MKRVTSNYKYLLVFMFSVSLYACKAQEQYYRVYEYETPIGGHLEANVWNTFIPKSDLTKDYFNKTISRKELFAHSAELEYGITDHLSLAAYADFQDPENSRFKFIQPKVEARYRFKERYDNFINTAVYLEYYFPDQSASNTQEIEAKLILDKDINDFRLVANPSVSKYIGGDENKDLHPGLSAGLYYRRLRFIQPGIEYYTNFYDHTQEIFPAVNLHPSPSITWNIGVGFGLNSNCDNLIVKSVFSIDMQAIRPTKLFRQRAPALK